MKIDFPLLTAEQINVKVKQVTANGAVALLYKSARVDMDMLDDYVGVDKWECDYKEIKGNLFCGIGILHDNGFIWKWDCGVESAQTDGNEKKAEASDAFKRAGFRWGIGRELYTAPFTFLKVETKPKGNNAYELVDKFARFVVGEIAYENRRISKLTIINANTGAVVFAFGAKQKPNSVEGVTPDQVVKIKKLFTEDRIADMLKHYKIKDVSALSKSQATMIINTRLKQIEKEAREGKTE